MNHWLYIVIEAGFLTRAAVAIRGAFLEAAREDPGGKPDDEPS